MRGIFLLTLMTLAFPAYASSCPDIPPSPRTDPEPAVTMIKGRFSLDESGVLIFDYGESYGGLGKWRNPYFISNYANALYRDYLGGGCEDDQLKNAFITQVDYLASIVEFKNNMALWRYPFAQPLFDLEEGWISAIGQSRIAGVLYRAFALTGDSKFYDLAEAAMLPYTKELIDGGVVTKSGSGMWLEEAPNPSGQSYKILNGHITALAGVLDFYQISQESQWKDVFDSAVQAVRQDIEKFDAGFSSYYSLGYANQPMIAPRGDYNFGHVDQLLWLFDITSDPIFLEWASRFQAYEHLSDIYSAEGVDNENYGPEKANATYGNNSWYRSVAPTWLQIDLQEPTSISALAIDASIPDRAPRDFTVSVRTGEEWREVADISQNRETLLHVPISIEPKIEAVRIDISEHGSDGFSTLKAVMAVRAEPQYAEIWNHCNFAGGGRRAFKRAMDADLTEDMIPSCDGWVILPSGGKTTLDLAGIGNNVAVEISDSFDNWSFVGNYNISNSIKTIKIPEAKFVRVSFDKMETLRLIKVF